MFTSAFRLIQHFRSCSGDWRKVERHAALLFLMPVFSLPIQPPQKGDRESGDSPDIVFMLLSKSDYFFPSSTHESLLLFLTDLKKTGFCAACPYISFIFHPYQCALVNKKVNLDLPPHEPHRVPSPCLPLSAEPGLCARVPNPWMDTSLLNEPFLLTFLYTLIWRGRSCRR